jgi:hypothetical protein
MHDQERVEWDSDRESYVDTETGECLTREQCGDYEGYFEYWECQMAFATRELGEIWGKSHDYRFPSGWRVYAIPACKDPQLIEALKKI